LAVAHLDAPFSGIENFVPVNTTSSVVFLQNLRHAHRLWDENAVDGPNASAERILACRFGAHLSCK